MGQAAFGMDSPASRSPRHCRRDERSSGSEQRPMRRLVLDGAPDYEFGGQEFKFLRARQLNKHLIHFASEGKRPG